MSEAPSHVIGTMGDLKAWVSVGGPKQVGADQVLLNIEHNLLQAKFPEIVFSLHSSVQTVKEKVATMTGSSCETMDLYLNSTPLSVDNANLDAKLGFFSPANGAVLRVVDNNPFSLARNGGLEDVSQVEKYMMSDADYDKRANTYRAFKKAQIANDPTWKSIYAERERAAQESRRAAEAAGGVAAETDEQIRARIRVGQRCTVFPGDRRGEVMFVGEVPEFKTKDKVVWIGVKYDLPCGKNDGRAEEKTRYFTAMMNYGAFCRPNVVLTGEYPPEDDGDELDEEL